MAFLIKLFKSLLILVLVALASAAGNMLRLYLEDPKQFSRENTGETVITAGVIPTMLALGAGFFIPKFRSVFMILLSFILTFFVGDRVDRRIFREIRRRVNPEPLEY
ncbi:MAG: hypothetical protein D6675_09455 [Gemmatimonadetes bacterium]|nr:MAG: hypothetical protein D6675_09455 [Gemmatimonadota bacterium]